MGSRSATPTWSDHFSLTCFTSTLPVAERRGAGLTQRFEERHCVLVWTTRGEPGRVRIDWFHSHLSSSARSDLLCGIHFDAVPPARIAGIRAAVRQALPSNDEDQRRGITLRGSEHLRRS